MHQIINFSSWILNETIFDDFETLCFVFRQKDFLICPDFEGISKSADFILFQCTCRLSLQFCPCFWSGSLQRKKCPWSFLKPVFWFRQFINMAWGPNFLASVMLRPLKIRVYIHDFVKIKIVRRVRDYSTIFAYSWFFKPSSSLKSV